MGTIKRLAIVILISFGLLSLFQIAHAQMIYKWVDEKGTTHYAEDPNTVPEKYENKVQKKDMDEFPPLLPDRAKKPQSYSTGNTSVERTQRPRGECEIIGFSQYEVSLGKGTISERGTVNLSGGYGTYRGTADYSEFKETCVDITIQNNDRETKEITETNVVAITSKRIGTRDRFTPKPFSKQVRPTETSGASVCFGRKLPPISKVELRGL